MLKANELTDERSCLSKAFDDEMVFVLLGRDECAPEVIRFWIHQRVLHGKNKEGDHQLVEALRCAERMEGQRMTIKARK